MKTLTQAIKNGEVTKEMTALDVLQKVKNENLQTTDYQKRILLANVRDDNLIDDREADLFFENMDENELKEFFEKILDNLDEVYGLSNNLYFCVFVKYINNKGEIEDYNIEMCSEVNSNAYTTFYNALQAEDFDDLVNNYLENIDVDFNNMDLYLTDEEDKIVDDGKTIKAIEYNNEENGSEIYISLEKYNNEYYLFIQFAEKDIDLFNRLRYQYILQKLTKKQVEEIKKLMETEDFWGILQYSPACKKIMETEFNIFERIFS